MPEKETNGVCYFLVIKTCLSVCLYVVSLG